MDISYEYILRKELTAVLAEKKDLDDQLKRYKIGTAGEINTFLTLERMSAGGYTVLHNLKAKIDNLTCEIDALVIGINGIFVIEIKTPKKINKELTSDDFVFDGVERQLIEHFLIVQGIIKKSGIKIADNTIHRILCISKDKKITQPIKYNAASFPESYSVCSVDEITQQIFNNKDSVLNDEQIANLTELFKPFITEDVLSDKIDELQAEYDMLSSYCNTIENLLKKEHFVAASSKQLFKSYGSYRESEKFCEICDLIIKDNTNAIAPPTIVVKKRLSIPKCISQALITVAAIAAFVVIAILIQPQLKLMRAKELINSGDSTAGLKMLDQIKDTVPEAWTEIDNYYAKRTNDKFDDVYNIAQQEIDAGNYSYALTVLEMIPDKELTSESIQQCCSEIYVDAVNQHNKGNTNKSIELLETISEYYNVSDELNRYSMENIKQIGDTVYFGHTGLKWYVSEISDEYYTLLLSDCTEESFKTYDDAEKYLNTKFINNFNESEKSQLSVFDNGYYCVCPAENDLPQSKTLRIAKSGPYWLVNNNGYYCIVQSDGETTHAIDYIFHNMEVYARPIIRLKRA